MTSEKEEQIRAFHSSYTAYTCCRDCIYKFTPFVLNHRFPKNKNKWTTAERADADRWMALWKSGRDEALAKMSKSNLLSNIILLWPFTK